MGRKPATNGTNFTKGGAGNISHEWHEFHEGETVAGAGPAGLLFYYLAGATRGVAVVEGDYV